MTGTMRWYKKEFKWTHGSDNIFETLKQTIVELPMLAFPDFNKVFQFECNASSSVKGVVLSQEGDVSMNANAMMENCTTMLWICFSLMTT